MVIVAALFSPIFIVGFQWAQPPGSLLVFPRVSARRRDSAGMAVYSPGWVQATEPKQLSWENIRQKRQSCTITMQWHFYEPVNFKIFFPRNMPVPVYMSTLRSLRFLWGSEFKIIQTKNRSVLENAETRIWRSCSPIVMGSWCWLSLPPHIDTTERRLNRYLTWP